MLTYGCNLFVSILIMALFVSSHSAAIDLNATTVSLTNQSVNVQVWFNISQNDVVSGLPPNIVATPNFTQPFVISASFTLTNSSLLNNSLEPVYGPINNSVDAIPFIPLQYQFSIPQTNVSAGVNYLEVVYTVFQLDELIAQGSYSKLLQIGSVANATTFPNISSIATSTLAFQNSPSNANTSSAGGNGTSKASISSRKAEVGVLLAGILSLLMIFL